MNTCTVLCMVHARSRYSKVFVLCAHNFSFVQLSVTSVHQYLLMEGLLCARPVLESSFALLFLRASAEGLGPTPFSCNLNQGQPYFSPCWESVWPPDLVADKGIEKAYPRCPGVSQASSYVPTSEPSTSPCQFRGRDQVLQLLSLGQVW